MKNPITTIQTLYFETVAELKKCSWPTRKELGESTVVVVSSLIILSVYVTLADKIIEFGIRYVIDAI